MGLNQIKTVLLLGLLTGLMLGAGQLLGGRIGLSIAIILAVAMNFGSYWFSHKIVLAMYRAKPAEEKEYEHLHRMVEEVSRRAGMKKPEVYIMPSTASNAFATGRSENTAVVAFTEGIIKLLTNEELKAVISHEISHIKNKDMLVTSIAATIAGVISYVATIAQFAAIFGGFGDRDGDDNILGIIAMAIITPILALIIQLAISRSREYMADSSGAKTLGNGEALARALEKLESGSTHNPLRFGNQSTSSLFIVNPFRAGFAAGLLSTHPPLAKRTRRLRAMKF